MTVEYKNWQEEFVDINFTDQRLKSRFFKIIDAFAASPGKSTWAATGSRSSAKAAYRFFSNSEISKDELLDSISRATVEKIKCADAEWILAVQDTTAVDLETGKRSREWDTIAVRSKGECGSILASP